MKTLAIAYRAWPYGAWLTFIVLAYVATYQLDPYVYGFTFIVLGALSTLVTLCGLVVWMLSMRSQSTVRLHWVGVLSLLIAVSNIAAMVLLKAIRWV